MSDKQPEALRLADALEFGTYLLSVERGTTAAELRRLHEVNAVLVETLTMVLDCYNCQGMLTMEQEEAGYAAIAKATGEQQ